jgi:transcriptional regulator with XRE-family HTH domain
VDSGPTQEDVYRRFQAMWPGLTDEDLARKMGVSSRTIARIKKNERAAWFNGNVRLLRLAGYITTQNGDEAALRSSLELARLTAARLADEAEELAQLLEPRSASTG